MRSVGCRSLSILLRLGLCFFAPLDLTFSVWFFYLLGKAQKVVGGMTGWQKIAGFPYYDEQMFGAVLVIFFFALWGGREHLKNVLKTAWTIGRSKGNRDVVIPSATSDADEPISYQNALLGIVGGMAFLIFFCMRAGMDFWVIPLYFLGLFYPLDDDYQNPCTAWASSPRLLVVQCGRKRSGIPT